ncbi:Peptidase family M1 [Modestobacter sp. DSM 44400]|uniref:M1 family aminopeptidase n=1 Tax=Modestobacter sp. DSM 44400 TaxID=1550230 RepID=UPI0008944306|nr:M1 family aminopeptidase [Modestobacter sp. DSM 44400]SDX53045.1 Peptidase family M1 [Modestobacter sp. DSM 44400]
MSRRRGLAGIVLLLAVTTAGCESGSPPSPDAGATGTAVPSASSRSAPSDDPHSSAGPWTGACPAERAAPDPDRPVVDVDFSLSDDGRTVTGSESVVFTPDLPTGELVFRLVPNGPGSSEKGNRLTVDRVRGDDVTRGHYEPAAAGPPGGRYVLPLTRRLAAGESTEVLLDFTLALGEGAFDRVGTADGASWWASGAPLLAWEPGVGWAHDPFAGLLGETAISPAADTTLSVEVPAGMTVLMTGDQAEPSAPRDGRRTWTSSEPAARDVSVAAGDFTTAETIVDGVRVTAGVLPAGNDGGDGAETRAQALTDATAAALTALVDRFGAFPYRTLTVPQLTILGGGIEYPSSILLLGPPAGVLVHEVAHMWFYGMVGNSQFRDPWMDEAFASYAESVVTPVDPPAVATVVARAGDVGASMEEFPSNGSYVTAVYGKGAAMLLAAREAAGAAAFDAAVRCYVDARAWAIATPTDVATALAGLPAARDVLVAAGALDVDDLPG